MLFFFTFLFLFYFPPSTSLALLFLTLFFLSPNYLPYFPRTCLPSVVLIFPSCLSPFQPVSHPFSVALLFYPFSPSVCSSSSPSPSAILHITRLSAACVPCVSILPPLFPARPSSHNLPHLTFLQATHLAFPSRFPFFIHRSLPRLAASLVCHLIYHSSSTSIISHSTVRDSTSILFTSPPSTSMTCQSASHTSICILFYLLLSIHLYDLSRKIPRLLHLHPLPPLLPPPPSFSLASHHIYFDISGGGNPVKLHESPPPRLQLPQVRNWPCFAGAELINGRRTSN